MKFSEPTFETGGDFWPAPSNVPDVEAHALEEKLAQKSALRLRLTEVLALYSVQQRQATELQDAYDEIEFRKPSPSTKWALPPRESEKAGLQAQLGSAFQESKMLADRVLTVEAAANRIEENVAVCKADRISEC